MKNNFRIGLLLSIMCAVTCLTGCKKEDTNNKPSEEVIDQMVTNIIDNSNIQADVHVGPYESMLTGELNDIPEEAEQFYSSTIFDAPRDFETTVIYNKQEDVLNSQTIINVMSDIQKANKELGTISITDRGGTTYTNNLLTLSNAGTELKITNPNGYKYGEVYQIEINDAPFLSFANKSESIRKLTIEIEDDPSEEATYDVKKLRSNITNIDIDKVSNKVENQETETYTFDYDGHFPDLTKGDIFHVFKENKEDKYFDFYGEYQSKESIDNNLERITYTAPRMDNIYDEFHLKNKEAVDMTNSEIILTSELAASKFKQSGLARGLVKALLPKAEYDANQLTGIMDNFKIHVDVNIVNNRLSVKFGLGFSNIEIGNNRSRWFVSIDIGYEKVTDYYMDFDVDIRTEWIFPVGVDYKVKCIEECQTGYYFYVHFTRAIQPDRSSDPDPDRSFQHDLEEAMANIREGGVDDYVYGDDEIKPSTSGSRTTWPIVRVDIYYFTPITMRLQGEFYIDAGFHIDGLVKKETFKTQVDFNFTNMSGSDHDTSTKIHQESNWQISILGSISLEVGIKTSFSLSFLGMYDYIRVQAYAEWFVNLSASGMLALDISTSEAPTRVTGYIGIDLAITAGIRVGLNFKILIFEKNISALLWFEYLFRIKYENAIEHFSPVADKYIDMGDRQTMNIDETGALWVTVFDTITMSLKEKKLKAKETFSIFSGKLCPDFLENATKGPVFTYTPADDSLMSIDADGTIHIKDGTPEEFTTTFTIHVSNWAGTASDQTVSVHFKASDTKEVYVDNVLVGSFRPGYEFTLPEGPFIYGKEFQGYIHDGELYPVGEKYTMTEGTLHFVGKYRILPYYTVWFCDGLGNVVSEQRIMEGEAAIEPSAAMRDRFMGNTNFKFLNWTSSFDKIMGDTIVNSLYVEVK